MLSVQRINAETLVRVLIGGFALVMILLLAAGVMGINNIASIREGAAHLVRDSVVTTQLLDEVQRERGTLNAVFYNMGGEPEQVVLACSSDGDMIAFGGAHLEVWYLDPTGPEPARAESLLIECRGLSLARTRGLDSVTRSLLVRLGAIE